MTDFLLIGGLGMGEILLIVVLVLLLFGAKRIPELMKGLGKGIRSFKDGLNSSDVDDAVEKSDDDKK